MATTPGTFLVDQGRIVSATVADRVLQRRFAGLADDDRSPEASDQFRLEIELGATYADGTRAAVSWRPRAWVTFRPLGGSPEAKARPRGDGAVVAYEGAYPGVVAAFGGTSRQVKEFLRVERPGTAPELRYAIDRGPEFGALELSDGELWAYDVDGEALFAVMPPLVKDAQGTEVRGAWEVLDDGGQTLVRAALSYEGLVYPLLIDPSFDTPLWKADNRLNAANAQPPARGAAAIAYSRLRNEVVMFGGVAGTSYLRDTRVRFASTTTTAWDINDLSASATTKPTARAYAAMAAIDTGSAASAPLYLFGGQASDGKPSDELWRVAVSDTAAAWTQVTPTGPKTDATWPRARLLHGMAAISDTTLLLFGGVDKAGTMLTDTWSFDHSLQKWTRLCESCFPAAYGFATVPGRSRPTTRDMPVVFGGYSNGAYLSTPRRWNGTNWVTPTIADALVPTNDSGIVTSTVVPGSVSPQGRMLGFGFWSNTGKILLGGGVQASPSGTDTYVNDLWSWESPAANGGRWSRQASNTTLGLPGSRESAAAVYFELPGTGVSSDLSPLGLVFGGITSVTSAGSSTVIRSTRLYRAYADTVSLSVTRSNSVFNLVATTNIPDQQGYFVRRNGSVWELIPGCDQIITTTGDVSCSINVASNTAATAFAVLVRDSNVHAAYPGGAPGDGCTNDATTTDEPLCGLNSAFPGQAICTRNGNSNNFSCN
ncbi:MAG: hypothetical protein EOO75_05995 [Myxococcales bacterium]|nr:MAG: hypothetical protein EOO75_05995 [Myxococcales bacterium]